MRFMIIVQATPDSEAGRFPAGSEQLFAAMASYHEALAQAGVLLDASGLQPSLVDVPVEAARPEASEGGSEQASDGGTEGEDR